MILGEEKREGGERVRELEREMGARQYFLFRNTFHTFSKMKI